ncbi:hypothetical protein [Terasakiella sp. SH-1]|uniref:hypothetical protein n=1 Tax=Terasakiella sp. SH-1 TaxID=2560057 RepID=UPI0010741AEB|nr:hypothetical protein [Terasakiella sp. SH-1]
MRKIILALTLIGFSVIESHANDLVQSVSDLHPKKQVTPVLIVAQPDVAANQTAEIRDRLEQALYRSKNILKSRKITLAYSGMQNVQTVYDMIVNFAQPSLQNQRLLSRLGVDNILVGEFRRQNDEFFKLSLRMVEVKSQEIKAMTRTCSIRKLEGPDQFEELKAFFTRKVIATLECSSDLGSVNNAKLVNIIENDDGGGDISGDFDTHYLIDIPSCFVGKTDYYGSMQALRKRTPKGAQDASAACL